MMDLMMRKRIGFEALAVGLCFFSYFLLGSANVVFNVKHKFEARERRSLAALKAHDDRRHGRSLAAVDLPLGGNGSPTDTALALSLSLYVCVYIYIFLCICKHILPLF